jgi:adenine/guanine phosphoribosyltransferase-like PRPP-binding protein
LKVEGFRLVGHWPQIKFATYSSSQERSIASDVLTIDYDTEYSVDTLQIKTNSPAGNLPFIVDDLLATGRTITATSHLLRNNFSINEVKAGTIINLTFLPEKLLRDNNILYTSILEYDDV